MTTIDEYVAALDEPFRGIATTLQATIDAALPGHASRIYHSHPVWLADGRPVAGFKAYPRYVTLMIWNAAPITDDSGQLQPGARMSTVKLAEPGQVDAERIADWLRQAASRAEA